MRPRQRTAWGRRGFRRRRAGPIAGRSRRRFLRLECLEARQLLAGDLAITELVASNNVLLDADNDTPDWIEIHNPGGDPRDLAGWTLTDDPADLAKWEFLPAAIEPDQYLVVFASGKDRHPDSYLLTSDLNTSGDATFAVDVPAGSYELRLTMGDANRARDEMALYVQGELREVVSARARQFVVTTALADVTAAAGEQLRLRLEDRGGTTSRAVINALSITPAAGGEVLRFDFGTADSPLEPGFVPVTPADVYDAGTGYGWLPGAVISSQDRGLTQSERHTNFRLNADGDYLALVSPAGVVASEFGAAGRDFPPQYTNVSYGVVPAPGPLEPARTGYFLTPTPGLPNDAASAMTGPAIRNVSQNPGPLDDHEDLLVTAAVDRTNADVASVTLTYRVMFGDEVTVPMADDGSGGDATAGDGVYAGVIPHSASAPGEMVRWYVSASDSAGAATRAPLAAAAPQAVAVSEYFGTIVADPAIESNLPVLHWFVENPAAAETRGGTQASMFYLGEFYDNIHVDLHGQSTSGGGFPKKSFDVDFNPGRGFRFAADQARVSDFNLLTNYADKTKVRNTLAYETYRNAGHAYHVAFPVRVQRNGSFFSIHDWVGEAGAEYLERLGLDPDGALYKVNNRLTSTTVDVEKRTRNYEDRRDLQELVDSSALPVAERHAWWFDNLDIASWVNFLAAMVVTGNIDCCHKNFYVYRDSNRTKQWQIFPWDLDLSFGHNWNVNETYFDDDLVYNRGLYQSNELLRVLYDAPGFREMYLRRIRTLMDQLLQPPGTPASELKFEARIDELIAQIGTDGALDQAAWGFHSGMSPQSPQEAAEDLKNFYLPRRREFLYSHSDIPAAQSDNPQIVVAVVEAQPVSGDPEEQYVRLDNPGPAAVDISGWRLTGDIDLIFRGGTVIPAGGSLYAVADVRAFLGRASGPHGGQTLLVQGEFSGRFSGAGAGVTLLPLDPDQPAVPARLRITELNYHPYDPLPQFGDLAVDNDEFEFVELTNTSTAVLDLAGVAFTDGFDFSFGAVQLAAGQRILVVRNRAAFESRYGSGHAIAGQFAAGGLNNDGEQIRLVDDRGATIVEFTYSDRGDWPSRADGAGATLEVVDTEADYNDPGNWRGSSRFGGTPGAAAAAPVTDVVVNEVLARPAIGNPDRIELYNPTSHPRDVSGWYLSDDEADLLQFAIAAGTTIPAGGYLGLDETQFHFGLSGSRGDEVWLLESDAAGRPRRFADWVQFDATDTGTALGRWPDGAAAGVLFPMRSPSFGQANSGPATGAVVIAEIHYNPPPPAGFFQDFSAGTDAGFSRQLGSWQVTDGRYAVTPGAEGDTLALIPAFHSSTGELRISATLNIPSAPAFRKNGALIFDYQSPTDFKFLLMPARVDQWRFGTRDAEDWHFQKVVDDALQVDTDVEVAVEIRGSVARLLVGGLLKLSYDFGTPLSAGQVGLGSKEGAALFDNVRAEALGDWQQFEFVELASTGSKPLNLAGWRLGGAVEMTFAAGTTIAPGAALVAVGFDPAKTTAADRFRAALGIDAAVPLVGPYRQQLDDRGGVVELRKPLSVSDPGTSLILVDRAEYRDQAPWPLAAGGQGKALSRVTAAAFGSFAESWLARVPSPGSVEFVRAGDMNLGGGINIDDVAALVLAFSSRSRYEATYGVSATIAGDIDGDGDLDFDDIDDFVALVRGGTAAAAMPAAAVTARASAGAARYAAAAAAG